MSSPVRIRSAPEPVRRAVEAVEAVEAVNAVDGDRISLLRITG